MLSLDLHQSVNERHHDPVLFLSVPLSSCFVYTVRETVVDSTKVGESNIFEMKNKSMQSVTQRKYNISI